MLLMTSWRKARAYSQRPGTQGGGVGEYWAMPERSAQSFFPGEWFRPYDVGYLDEDGFLYCSDRAGDRIATASGTVQLCLPVRGRGPGPTRQ